MVAEDMRPAVIVDVDGTLVDVRTAEVHLQGRRRDFEAFHRAALRLNVNETVANIVRVLHSFGFAVLVVSGRAHHWHFETSNWLREQRIPFDLLKLRNPAEQEPDAAVKLRMLKEIEQEFQIVLAIDDNSNTIEVWRNNGISTVRVPSSMG